VSSRSSTTCLGDDDLSVTHYQYGARASNIHPAVSDFTHPRAYGPFWSSDTCLGNSEFPQSHVDGPLRSSDADLGCSRNPIHGFTDRLGSSTTCLGDSDLPKPWLGVTAQPCLDQQWSAGMLSGRPSSLRGREWTILGRSVCSEGFRSLRSCELDPWGSAGML
jgi:hypothetical protein